MKECTNCHTQSADEAMFCNHCGTPLSVQNTAQNGAPINPGTTPNSGAMPQYAAPIYDPYDHTSEFDPKDISDNKVMSMLVYLMGWIGIVIALLGSHSSPYAAFHVRQALKFSVVDIILGICALVLCWTFIVPFACFVMFGALFVIKIICFFQICQGKAKEPYIIRSLTFLR
ncbi:MAG: zinc-ribbon domain-containing protein [Clostridiales bacterium]|nr:zinc-ribbon domain-containing protein [Clostridiales bacterium]